MGSFPETYDDPKFPGGESLSDHIPGTRVEFWLQNQMQEKVCHCKKEDEKVSFDKYTIKFHFLKAVFEELNFGGAYIRRGLSTEGRGGGAYIWRGLYMEGLIHGRAYFRILHYFNALLHTLATQSC